MKNDNFVEGFWRMSALMIGTIGIMLMIIFSLSGCSMPDKYCAKYCDAKDYKGSHNGKKACYCSEKTD